MNFPDSPFKLPENWHYTGPFAQSKLVTDSVERLQNTVMKMINDDRQRQESTFNAVLAAVIQKYSTTGELRIPAQLLPAKITHHVDTQTGEHVFSIIYGHETGPSYDG